MFRALFETSAVVRGVVRCLPRMGRRGSVALLVGVSVPTVMMMAGISVEVGRWAITRAQLQRAADAAADAGARYYALSSAITPQSAAGLAADVAILNGAHAGARAWNAATMTLTDGDITVKVGTGLTDSTNTSFRVTTTRTVTPTFTGSVNIGARTITASAAADSMPGSNTLTACMIALDQSGGITEQDITDNGHSTTNLQNCAIRSNASMKLWGSVTVNAGAVYSTDEVQVNGSATLNAGSISGEVSVTGSSTVTGTILPPVGPIADPYASNSGIVTAFAQLSATGKPAFTYSASTDTSLSPGVWSKWSISGSGTITLAPGLYVVTGNISLGGSARLVGSGVTIVHGGSLSASGTNTVQLTAPGTSPTGGGIPAVLLASPTGGSVSFSGDQNFPLSGVIYYPNATVSWSGSTVSASGCLELIARTISISGANVMASAGCSAMGAAETSTGTPGTAKLLL